MTTVAMRVLVSLVLSYGVTGSETAIRYPVSSNLTFQVEAEVEGAEGEQQTLIFDTGSTFSWLFHYTIVRRHHPTGQGGYSATRLRTRIISPMGGDMFQYVDNTVVQTSDWTSKKFKIGDHEWEQSFGINRNVHRAVGIGVVGLIGASPGSDFSQIHRIFGFDPVSRKLLNLNFDRVDPTQKCWGKSMSYFPRTGTGKYWAAEGIVSFAAMRFRRTIAFDTGSTVIALPQLAFGLFVKEMLKHDSSYQYYSELLFGSMDCAKRPLLPTWTVSPDNLPEHGVLITPHMYVMGLEGNRCMVAVARVANVLPIIMGIPLLQYTISEFDSENHRVGVCQPIKPVVPDLKEYSGRGNMTECPRCSSGVGTASVHIFVSLAVMFLS